ncbi:MAG: hypothetical protein JNJ46_35050 [Myxococcales bacterium]|nr:hypothetical protein [Myxococcales bacterium]
MSEIDAKEIGLGVKDVVVGVAGVVAGAYAGEAGANAVLKAGSGIDRLIAAATGGGGTSQAQKFDRSGFEPKPALPGQPAATTSAAQAAASPAPAPAAQTVAVPASAPPQAKPATLGDREQLAALLTGLGWRPDQVGKILDGPAKAGQLEAIAPMPVEGNRVALVEGRRVETVAGSPEVPVPARAVPAKDGVAVMAKEGKALMAVSGTAVPVKDAVAVLAYDGTRVDPAKV